jgi:soluble P-type ATPase
MIEIPNFKTLNITEIVCDYNGTIATDGILLPEVKSFFTKLSKKYQIHVITADTFGTVAQQLLNCDVELKILSSQNHTDEKAAYIQHLGAKNCVALGNGNNDREMLLQAAIGIVILGDEGCSKDTLLSADILFKDISDAFTALLHTKRLIASLRN